MTTRPIPKRQAAQKADHTRNPAPDGLPDRAKSRRAGQ
jgi:hypothetical protein